MLFCAGDLEGRTDPLDNSEFVKENSPTAEVLHLMEQDQIFVDYLIKAIVNNPDAVHTERTVDERGVLITLHVDPSDMGYVIGRDGQTARAVRTLLKIVGAKNNARVNLKIYEPEGSRRPPRREREEGSINRQPQENVMDSGNMGSSVDTSDIDDLGI